MALSASGFRTVEARSADEAVAFLEEHNGVDAIFTDISMPGSMNGLGLAHHVRRKKPFTYVLITSGDDLPAEEPIPPYSDFVPKPYALPHIAEMLRQHVSQEK